MKKTTLISSGYWWMILLFLALFSTNSFSQTANDAICDEGDCSPSVFNIKMNEPSMPIDGTFSKQRTEKFKKAWQEFEQTKNGYANTAEWKAKYNASQLGGKSCLRHYQLESYFANEYSQNADFKTFVQSQGASPKYLENGFQSSRKGLNLEKRMNNNCPDQVKETEKKPGPKLSDMPNEYMNLGKQLGYFDEQGKPTEKFVQETVKENKPKEPAKKMSKKEQVEDLKNRVAALPVATTQNKINNTDQSLKNAKQRSGKLGNFLKKLIPAAAAFLAPQLPLVANLGKIKDFLGGLLAWKPKLPRLGLMDKIKGLFNKGKKLKDKGDKVLDKSKKLKDKAEELGDKAKKIGDGIEDKIKDVTDLKDQLAALENKKKELEDKLADKPKKILDELKGAVADIEDKAKEIQDKADKAEKDKDKLLKDLEDTEKAAEDLAKEKENLVKDVEDLKAGEQELQKETDEVAAEVEEAKKEDEKVADMEKGMENLPSDEDLNQALAICEDDLKSLLLQIEPVKKTQEKINKQFDKVKDKPKKLFDKIRNLKIFQEKLKVPKVDIPIADKTLKKVDGLMEKATVLGGIAEILTGKKTKLQEQIENMDKKFNTVQDAYKNRQEKLEKLKGDLIHIIAEKSGLKKQFENAMDGVDDLEKAYDDFIKKYNVFNEDSKCVDQKELEEKLEELKEEQVEVEPEVEELEKEVEEVEEKEVQLEEETKEVEEEIEEETQQAEEIKKEEEKIKESFGQEVDLEPVTTEEWTESFEVEREYWDATFHPDDEVVDGYKGRWFQIKLKDANKNVKLLFGPGEYFMGKSDFRDNYGSVIIAFVTEALKGMKKSEQGEVKLFVQGSADITGQKTFRGKLDDGFMYDRVTVLPQKGKSENFENTPADKNISATSFTNDDLPDLRGKYLKEMISVYSRKLDPILLEGSVKSKENKEDRNAVIYLFFPDSLVEKYED